MEAFDCEMDDHKDGVFRALFLFSNMTFYFFILKLELKKQKHHLTLSRLLHLDLECHILFERPFKQFFALFPLAHLSLLLLCEHFWTKRLLLWRPHKTKWLSRSLCFFFSHQIVVKICFVDISKRVSGFDRRESQHQHFDERVERKLYWKGVVYKWRHAILDNFYSPPPIVTRLINKAC